MQLWVVDVLRSSLAAIVAVSIALVLVFADSP